MYQEDILTTEKLSPEFTTFYPQKIDQIFFQRKIMFHATSYIIPHITFALSFYFKKILQESPGLDLLSIKNLPSNLGS